jgi:membrane fusion protein (multidrug efflux system)
VAVAALLLAAIYGWQSFVGRMMKKGMAAAATAPQVVSAIAAKPTVWQSQLHAVGSLRAVRGADLAAEIGGVVDALNFDSGNQVQAGAVLLRLRLNDDPAKLLQLQAAAELAEQNYKRDQEQFAAQAISQAVLDSDASTLKSARAAVTAQQALIGEKIVKAPFAGRLGIRQVDLGQYLSPGTTIVTLQALDPILIDFYLPQQALANIRDGQAVSATVDTYPGVVFAGVIESINSKVDSASRNFQVRASFKNADHRLVPGMYAGVDVASGDAQTLITLPATAITYNPFGDTVYAVLRGEAAGGSAAATVQQRFVSLGETRGDQVAVLKGVSTGDVIVTGGQLKLRNGAHVVVNNGIVPTDDAHPAPPNE